MLPFKKNLKDFKAFRSHLSVHLLKIHFSFLIRSLKLRDMKIQSGLKIFTKFCPGFRCGRKCFVLKFG